ncbi:hypothetical protein ACIXBV_07585 [Bacteroides fragilis]
MESTSTRAPAKVRVASSVPNGITSKKINGVEIDTGIVRHTNLKSLGRQNEGNRRAYEWFDPVIRNRINELADIVTDYFDTMLIDATRIYIDKRNSL